MVHTIIEGGQTWAHRLRMFCQVLKVTLFASLSIGLAVFVCTMAKLPRTVYQASWYYLIASLSNEESIEVDQNFWVEVAHESYFQSNFLIGTKRILQITTPYFERLIKEGEKQLKFSSLTVLLAYFLILLFFSIRGRLLQSKTHISGRKRASPEEVTLKLRITGSASSIKIGGLALVKGSETQHTLITGGTGTGKTNCLYYFLKQIRKDRQKAIIIDTSGAFQDFYREKKDFILNPFSSTISWHPWAECQLTFDFEALAESFIPHSYSDHESYWRIAARSLFSTICYELRHSMKTSEIVQWLLYEPLPKLCQFVSGTKASAHMDLSSEKTAGSVRSVAASFLSCLEWLKDTTTPFSIREWIGNSDSDSWLFLQCTPSQRSALNPLFTAWVSMAIRSLLNLTPDLNRRVWYILDELPSLNKIKDLELFVSEGRKYGGAGVMVIQSPAQLETIYGQGIAKTIVGNCATKIAFSEQEPEISEKISKLLEKEKFKNIKRNFLWCS